MCTLYTKLEHFMSRIFFPGRAAFKSHSALNMALSMNGTHIRIVLNYFEDKRDLMGLKNA